MELLLPSRFILRHIHEQQEIDMIAMMKIIVL